MIKIENIDVYGFETAIRGMPAKGYEKQKMVMKYLYQLIQNLLALAHTKLKKKQLKLFFNIELSDLKTVVKK